MGKGNVENIGSFGTGGTESVFPHIHNPLGIITEVTGGETES